MRGFVYRYFFKANQSEGMPVSMTDNFAESNDISLSSEILYHRREGLFFFILGIWAGMFDHRWGGEAISNKFFGCQLATIEEKQHAVNRIKNVCCRCK